LIARSPTDCSPAREWLHEPSCNNRGWQPRHRAATAQPIARRGAAVGLAQYRLERGPPASTGPSPGQAYYLRQQTQSADQDVWAIDRSTPGTARARSSGGPGPRDRTNLFALFDIAESTIGRLNVLVNNAVHCRSDTFVPDSDADAILRKLHRDRGQPSDDAHHRGVELRLCSVYSPPGKCVVADA
jgi:hypothetical protein